MKLAALLRLAAAILIVPTMLLALGLWPYVPWLSSSPSCSAACGYGSSQEPIQASEDAVGEARKLSIAIHKPAQSA